MANKTLAKGAPVRGLLILSGALALCLALVIAGIFVVNARGNIFRAVSMGGDKKNEAVQVADDLGITYVGSYDNCVMAYDQNENLLWTYDMAGSTAGLAYDEQLKYLIVGSQDRNIHVLNAVTGEAVHIYPFNGRMYDLDYDPATHRAVGVGSVSASKATVAVMDIQTGETTFSKSLKVIAEAVRFSDDYRNIIYGDNRSFVYMLSPSGDTLFEVRLKDKVIMLDVARDTGDLVAVTEGGYYYRFEPSETKVYTETQALKLVGEGYSVAITDDGRLCGVGMREGDVYILDETGAQHFYQRLNAQITQIYIGNQVSYVVTKSNEMFRFDTDTLADIQTYMRLAKLLPYPALLLAVMMAVCLIIGFPASRNLAARFFKALFKHRTAYMMLLPTFALVIVFNYYPVAQAFYFAFTDWASTTPTMRDVKFVGFDNFIKMVSEGYFLMGMKNMVIIMLTSFLKLLTVPVILALLVYGMKSNKQRYWYRLLLIAPMVVPGVVSVLMWKNIYDPNVGALNALLESAGLGAWKQSWLGSEKTALASIIFMGFPWVNGLAFLVFYGGLIDIPMDLFEAARVDGSNRWWDLWHIKIPLITPQLKMMLILTFIGAIQDYGGVLLLTGGGPGSVTYVPGLELYFNATTFGQYGYACALGLVMFVFILGGTILNLKMKTQEIN